MHGSPPVPPPQHGSPARKAIAVIPARGGSKGVPRKNVRLLGGVPLIVHTIRAALASQLLDTVVVSTEDEEIARVAAEAGALVVDRPAELSTDTVQNTDVVRHALHSAQGAGHRQVVLLQPTSPLRGADAIDACLRLLSDGQGGAVRSAMTVTGVEHHPGKALRLDAQGFAQPFTDWRDMEARRQDLPEVFRQNGAVYALGVEDFLREDRFLLPPCRVHAMPAAESVDIDSEFDFFIAEKLLDARGRAAGT